MLIAALPLVLALASCSSTRTNPGGSGGSAGTAGAGSGGSGGGAGQSVGGSAGACSTPEGCACDDWNDNDGDGLVDCQDVDCQGSKSCASGAAATGDACIYHSDCKAQNGAPYCEKLFPGGYCMEFCNLQSDDCGAGRICLSFGNLPLCQKICNPSTPSDCRPDYECKQFGGPYICFPKT